MPIPPVALALVFAASVGWSCLDACRKRLVREASPVGVLLALTAGSLPLFAVWWGASGWGGRAALTTWDYWQPAIGSILGNVAANLALLAALRAAPISATIPMLSLTPVFVTLFSIPLLGEIPGPLQGLGAVLVVAGALVLHPPALPLAIAPGGALRVGERPVRDRPAEPPLRASGGSDGERDPPRKVGPSAAAGRGVALAGLTALLWSITLPLDKRAIAQSGGPLHALLLNAGVAVAVLALLARRRAWGEISPARIPLRSLAGPLALAIAVSSLAMGLQYLALGHVPAGLVETIKRGVGNGMAVVWGRQLFGETIAPRVVVGAALMALGVGVILL